MSRDELASLVNAWLRRETGETYALDERAIGRWERGKVQQPRPAYRAALRAVLAVDHDWEIGFADPPIAPGLPPITNGTAPEVDAIRAMATSVHAVDRRLGGGKLYASVVTYLQADVARALFAPSSGAQVYAAAATLTEIAGWMAHDSGRDVDARTHFDGSYRLSLAAGSPALAANMCASMSHLAGQLGQVEDALRLAEVGLDRVAETGGIARVSARLQAMRAKALAACGDSEGCQDALARAERALGGNDDNEHASWSAHFDEGSFAAEAATALHWLGDLSGAERQAQVVLDLRRGDRVRAMAFGRLTLASIVLDAGRADEAAALGSLVSTVAPHLSSARVRARLGELALAIRARPPSATTSTFLADMATVDSGRTAEVMNAWPV